MDPRSHEYSDVERSALGTFMPIGISNLLKGRYDIARARFYEADRGQIRPYANYYIGLCYFFDAKNYSGNERQLQYSTAAAYLKEAIQFLGDGSFEYEPHIKGQTGNLRYDINFFRARCEFELKNYGLAILHLPEAFAYNGAVLPHLARAQAAHNLHQQALNSYELAIKNNQMMIDNEVIKVEEIFKIIEKLPPVDAVTRAKECTDESTPLGKYVHSQNGLFNRTVARAQRLLAAKEAELPERKIAPLIEKAVKANQAKDYQSAFAFATEAYKIDEKNVQAIRAYTYALAHTNKIDDAFWIINQLLAASPDNHRYLEIRAGLHIFNTHYAAATQDINKVLAVDEKAFYAYALRVKVLVAKQEYEEADLAYKRLIELAGSKRDAYSNYIIADLDLILAKHNLLKEKAIRLYADWELKQCSEAKVIEIFSQALAENPNDQNLHFLFGKFNLATKKYNTAIDLFKKAETAFENKQIDLTVIYSHLAEAYYKNERFDSAIATATLALALSPKNAELYVASAKYKQCKGEYVKAMKDWIDALLLKPELVNKREIFVNIMKMSVTEGLVYAGLCFDPNHVLSHKIHEGDEKEDYPALLRQYIIDNTPKPVILPPVVEPTLVSLEGDVPPPTYDNSRVSKVDEVIQMWQAPVKYSVPTSFEISDEEMLQFIKDAEKQQQEELARRNDMEASAKYLAKLSLLSSASKPSEVVPQPVRRRVKN